jgi:hypothetical protein
MSWTVIIAPIWAHRNFLFANPASDNLRIIAKVNLAFAPSASGILVLSYAKAFGFRSARYRDSYDTARLANSRSNGPNVWPGQGRNATHGERLALRARGLF